VPQQKAAFKAIKVSNKKYLRNQRFVNEIKTLQKKFRDYLVAKDAENVRKSAVVLVQKINKAQSKGIIHKTAASRKISRIMQKTAALT
jgi:small subunit ribosomal protein S20